MSKEGATIVSLSSLMSEKIGGEVDDKEKSDLDLKAAITGEDKKDDFFELDTAKANELEAARLKEEEESKVVDLESTEEDKKKKEEKASKGEFELTQSTSNEDKTDTEDFDKSEFYKRSLKTMFGDTISHIIEEDEQGNEKEVLLQDTLVTEEFYNQIVKSKLDDIKEEASKDKISTKGISDFARDLVEIDRNNGDISELLRAKEAYSDPLDNLDLTTEQGQVQAVYLRMMAGGQDEDTTRRLITSYKAEGILEEKALEAETELKAAIQKQVENAKEAAQKQADERRSLLKDYKKDIKESLDRYQLNDNIKNKVVLLATKEDDNGRFELDKVYYQHRENPKDAADLAFFLLDKEEFIKHVTNKAVEETKLNTSKKLRVVTDGGGNNPTLAGSDERRKGGGASISIASLND